MKNIQLISIIVFIFICTAVVGSSAAYLFNVNHNSTELFAPKTQVKILNTDVIATVSSCYYGKCDLMYEDSFGMLHEIRVSENLLVPITNEKE